MTTRILTEAIIEISSLLLMRREEGLFIRLATAHPLKLNHTTQPIVLQMRKCLTQIQTPYTILEYRVQRPAHLIYPAPPFVYIVELALNPQDTCIH